ncbi:hypothetical protein LSH36_814g01034 [Paralvinella palmiformis]|uniref:Potassium channel domain-containing protein n=1 Tax=Paralvinella palmiformis TaxID=53620 RepID=A0AAD9MTZ8_9ANNE|nr:hypothetical protein LSH36_814g01034 [Paralvinella palmiformis]
MAKSTSASKVGEVIKDSASQSISLLGRVHRFCRRLYRIVSSTVGLVVALIVYSVVGAAIFHAIEGRHEVAEKSEILALRERIINETWANFTEDFDAARAVEFAEHVRGELARYEAELHEAFLHGVNTDSDVYVWDFWSAFLFCATVYTTIVDRQTKYPRIMAILVLFSENQHHINFRFNITRGFSYSFKKRLRPYRPGHRRWTHRNHDLRPLRHPLVSHRDGRIRQEDDPGAEVPLVVCASILPNGHVQEGPRRQKPVKAIEKTIQRQMAKDKEPITEDTEEEELEQPAAYLIDDDFNLPPIIAIAITVVYICAGAAMYRKWESGWSYLDAFYFIFISISTVGFGDVLPDHPRYFLASSIYILLGLSLVAMVINVIMDVVSDTLNKAKVKVIDVGQKMGINLSAEDIDEAGTQKTEAKTAPTEK